MKTKYAVGSRIEPDGAFSLEDHTLFDTAELAVLDLVNETVSAVRDGRPTDDLQLLRCEVDEGNDVHGYRPLASSLVVEALLDQSVAGVRNVRMELVRPSLLDAQRLVRVCLLAVSMGVLNVEYMNKSLRMAYVILDDLINGRVAERE